METMGYVMLAQSQIQRDKRLYVLSQWQSRIDGLAQLLGQRIQKPKGSWRTTHVKIVKGAV